MSTVNSKKESEKNEAVEELESMKQSVAEMKIKIGKLEADNEKLEKGGGRDIDLGIELDLIACFEFIACGLNEKHPCTWLHVTLKCCIANLGAHSTISDLNGKE